jgi:hypothetical protein
MPRQINYVALVAGILTLVLIAISAFIPWWQFNIGNPVIAQIASRRLPTIWRSSALY